MVSRSDNAVEALAGEYKKTWLNITACTMAAEAERARIAGDVSKQKLVPADCSFLTFGSLARDELTTGSDIDWALLIDGAADPQHADVAKRIAFLLKDKPPGPTNVFGCPIFSHELVHLIGGQADTNTNTTRRILLLLESRSLVEHSGVRERVLRHLFRRYVEEDRGYHAAHDYNVRVPRFLLNDVVRFWRTMTVDYAQKRRERESKGWAIRNFKLRVSRKLVFVAGLAMCLSCQLKPTEALSQEFASEDDFANALQDFLLDFTKRKPLQIVAEFAVAFHARDAAVDVLSSYDRFLGLVNDADKRKHLEQLDVDAARDDQVFGEARSIGTDLQKALTKLFFESDDELTKMTQRYGVF